MSDSQPDNYVLVQPRDVLVFYRNQSQQQAAATISITRLSSYAKTIKYKLQTTNKKAYKVSSTHGELPSNQTHRYIYVIINQDAPLEKCLLDHFKLIIYIDDTRKFVQKTFSVIIDYKKELKIIGGNTSQLQTSSYASGSISGVAATVLNYSIAMSQKNSRKQYRLRNYLRQGCKEKVDLERQLDYLMKAVEEKRLKLFYIRQEQLKRSFREKFGFYIILIVIVLGLLLGLLSRLALKTTLKVFETIN